MEDLTQGLRNLENFVWNSLAEFHKRVETLDTKAQLADENPKQSSQTKHLERLEQNLELMSREMFESSSCHLDSATTIKKLQGEITKVGARLLQAEERLNSFESGKSLEAMIAHLEGTLADQKSIAVMVNRNLTTPSISASPQKLRLDA